ncbi:DUF1656 domain-containing protein [Pantoea sp. PNA 03-3]|uniref:DUF1656 domain-containing protein n=1 Tax=Pantoea sp. PNA 03-3 TaxID=2135460 RepID=UPI000D774FB7|nr:DUF1656 domain-containing protein [Pantoea sp. PNA 03-3]PXV78356.1 uncharacterized protein DUF1656 [Pantoea sp. PNA 03-3]
MDIIRQGFFSISPFSELIFGASLYFPPLFKAVLAGFVLWLFIHPLLRGWLASGEVWHPTLFDLSLFVLCVTGALWLMAHG